MRKCILTLSCILVSILFMTSCSRSDIEIQGDVRNAIIFSHPGVEIGVGNGVVTLGGRVESEEAKTEIEKLVSEIDGVKTVNNKMEVWIPEPVVSQDQLINLAVSEEFKAAKIEGVEVTVKDEEVTLSGELSKADHKKVQEAIKKVKTKKVIDQISVKK